VSQLGPNLREIRQKLGLTQEEVGERSGIPQGEISRIEHGERDPRVSTLVRLAKALEVSPGQLLE
jgi:transcriptional regulator with XRE-family HTH domain